MEKKNIHLEQTSSFLRPFSYWLRKNWYYHKWVKNFYRAMVPRGKRVLHINGKNGYVLDTIKPSFGVCLDEDMQALAEGASQYPIYQFVHGTVAELPDEKFDYILLSLVTMEVANIQTLLQQLHRFSHARTRIIVESYSHLWEPVLICAQKLGLKRPTHFKNWFSPHDLHNLLKLADFDVIKTGRSLLFPLYIPLISSLCNGVLAHFPILKHLCLHYWLVIRPSECCHDATQTSVSVIIPCKNEKETIEQAVCLCPQMGEKTELIFVDGHSTDGTVQEVQRVQQAYPTKDIKLFVQQGKGKGDAARLGFKKAEGDIVMILDADLTVPPQELEYFFEALIQGHGEFINGSRLVYRMESHAMGLPSMLANFFFSNILSWILGQKLKDTLCGTKVLWKRDYQEIAANRKSLCKLDPFGDFDLLFGAAWLNLKIIDLPVHYKNRTYGTTSISRFWHGWVLCAMCVVAFKKFKL